MRLGITRTVVACTAAVLVAAVSSCGTSETTSAGPAVVEPPKNPISAGSLTYGTAATFAPFESQSAGGDVEGFDIDLANALADSMGLTPKPMDMDFDGLIPALAGKRTDVINSAMYITPEREQKADFVPYLTIGEALLTPPGNPAHITRVPEDLAGKTIAVTRGAIGETYMNEFNEQLSAMGLAPMNVMTLPNNQDAMLAVRSGRADAFDTSTPGAATTVAKTNGAFTIAATFKNETRIGIAVRKGDTDMAAAVRRALDHFVQTGGYQALLDEYRLPPESNPFAAQSPPQTDGGS